MKRIFSISSQQSSTGKKRYKKVFRKKKKTTDGGSESQSSFSTLPKTSRLSKTQTQEIIDPFKGRVQEESDEEEEKFNMKKKDGNSRLKANKSDHALRAPFPPVMEEDESKSDFTGYGHMDPN